MFALLGLCVATVCCAQLAQVRKPAPSFQATAVIDGDFKDITLETYKGRYLVLFFYPMDFTFVCPTEIIAFSDRVEEFRRINTEVVAVSVDSKYTHLAWINTPRSQGGLGKMNIPLVSDITKRIAADYGVLVPDGPDAGVAFRGLFIINEQGIVRHVSINDLPVGRSVDEVLRLVQAFQYTDKHDQVCPQGWQPGHKTMEAHPVGKLSYFESLFSS